MDSEIVYDHEYVVDASLYSTDVVLRSSYRLTDRFYVFLVRDGDSTAVRISRKPGTPTTAEPLGELSNTLIDEALRERIRTETASIRDLLVKAALSGVSHD